MQAAVLITKGRGGEAHMGLMRGLFRLQSGTSSEAAKYLTGTMSCIRYMKFDKTNYTMESTFITNKLLTQ